MGFKYVIFDFDGTLADTEKVIFNIAQQLSKKYKFKNITFEELKLVKKLDPREAIKFLEIKKRRIPAALRKGRKILKNDIQNVMPCKENLSDIIMLLKEKGIKIGILTTNSQKNVEAFLKNNNMDFFDFVLNSSLFGKELKLKKIMKKENVKAEDILYVGDEIRDIIAAHLVHIKIASVTWGFNSEEGLKRYKPNYLIKEPEELLPIVLN